MCDAAYTTTESIDYTKNLLVRDRTKKSLVPLQRDQLFLSLYKSLGHRRTALTDAAGLCDTVITKIAPLAVDGVIDAQRITETTLVALNRFDKLAAQHYAAFHGQQ